MRICLFTINAKDFNLPPYGIWTIKTYLDYYKENYSLNIDVKIFSFNHESDPETILNTIENYNPDLIGASHYIWNDESILNIIRDLKMKMTNARIVIGGPHSDYKNQRLNDLLLTGILDAIVVGEGEEPFLKIVQSIISYGSIKPTNGVVCIEDGKVSSFIPQVVKKGEIDYLPNPYIVSKEVLEESLINGSIQYETSRGCPFNCSFCDQGHKSYRSLSMSRIKDDLDFFAKYRPKHIDFLDGTFNLSPLRTIEVLEHLISLDLDWTIHAEIKPENLSFEEILLMKKANFKSVELGLQSIHLGTLKLIKRRNDYKKIEETVTNLNSFGINVTVNTIIGLPDETLENWFETLDYCFNIGKVQIVSNLLKLLPNTILFDQIERFQYEYRIDNFNSIIKSKHFSEQDIKYALIINRIVDLFWNKNNMPDYIKNIVQNLYSNKFHLLLIDISNILLDKNHKIEIKKNFQFLVIIKLLQNHKENNKYVSDLILEVEQEYLSGGNNIVNR
ncbi:Radical SAM superfamily enzyme YgiQ, UPF0313 family [Paenibacillus sophorae]|uniref:B12-binding domain-containing radical SAM protein n=1 Tax=Paenibacillus sophorae TaxID=1333845 RepID=A0A1H8J241_9BACL|nr:radical SAM protein [Paenibacillus sophorae]QWU16166.1 B12-binding domain-containing radical SAM protein [Paenibacillus sophorae]SEN74356.1 Radical SAM superfamily enzyme YgiQ, UPF0313 family [Paenibacillus sophorae]